MSITIYQRAKKGSSKKTAVSHVPDTWLHVVAPTDEESATLAREYGIDTTIVSDIQDIFEVPRFEYEGNTGYFFTRYIYDGADIDTAPILFVLGKQFLVSIAPFETPFLSQRVSRETAPSIPAPRLFLECLGDLILSYERKLTKIRKHVYADMRHVRNIRGREIQRLVFLEQEINEIISTVTPTYSWLNQVSKAPYNGLFQAERDQLEDVVIATGQLADSAKSILKSIQNVRNATEAILTQNLNTTIRMLTALTIILTIPTLVSSLFGMNVVIPFADSPWGFWYILGGIGVMVTLTLHFFSKNRWL